MLKKRILASSLASVMALSSVSVVAFADDKTETPKTEAVTKEQLKDYIESLDSFMDSDIKQYGDIQTEQLEDAIEYAENVLSSRFSTADTYTSAYQMVKSLKEGLTIYTSEQLQDLIDDYKSDYESDNILNEVLKDKIWDVKTYKDFTHAYDDAEDDVDSKDSRIVTNAYVALEDAHKNLKPLDTVTKSAYEKAIKDYEDMVAKFKDYEGWRRGVCKTKSDSSTWKKSDGSTKVNVTNAKFVTFKELQNIVYGTSDAALKGSGQSGSGVWMTVSTNVNTYVNKGYKDLDDIDSTSMTSKPEIIKAYDVCVNAVEVFNGWEVDDADRGSQSAVESLIDDYRARLVKEGVDPSDNSDADGVTAKSYLNGYITDLTTADKGPTVTIGSNKFAILEKTTDGKIKVKDAITGLTNEKLQVNLDADGMLVEKSGKYSTAVGDSDAAVKGTATDVELGQDLTDLIPITSTSIDKTIKNAASATATTAEAVAAALQLYDYYVAEEAKEAKESGTGAFGTAFTTDTTALASGNYDLDKLDENNLVDEADGSRAEYALIWRNPKYALEDLLPAPGSTYDKKDVEDLIEKADELTEKTVLAETFADDHQALVTVRQAAKSWLAAADNDRSYEDGKTVTFTAGDTTYSGDDATTVYNALEEEYDDLEEIYKKYPKSYGEIAELVADAANGLDAAAYGNKTDEVKALMQKVAIELSTLEASDKNNQAFDNKRKFKDFNRILTDDPNDAEKQLYADYLALAEAMEKATEAAAAGDVDGNGTVDLDDAQMVVDAYVGTVTLTDGQTTAADMDGDGDVDLDDAQKIVDAYVGL